MYAKWFLVVTSIIMISSSAFGETTVLSRAATDIILEVILDNKYLDPDSLDENGKLELYAAVHLAGRLDLKEAVSLLERLNSEIGSMATSQRATFGQGIWLEISVAMVRLGQSDWLPPLVKYMNSEKGFNKIVAAKTLLEFDPKNATPILRSVFQSQNSEDMFFVSEALSKVGDKDALEFLLAGIKQDNFWIQVICANYLAKAGRNDGQALLQEAFRSDDLDTKLWGAEGLAYLRDEDAKYYMRSLLNNVNSTIVELAIGSLGHLSDSGVRRDLELLATDQGGNSSLRTLAIRAIGNIGDQSSLPVLKNLLVSDDKLVEIAAAASILQIQKGIWIPMMNSSQ